MYLYKYKKGFGIKSLKLVEMSWNQTKPNQYQSI